MILCVHAPVYMLDVSGSISSFDAMAADQDRLVKVCRYKSVETSVCVNEKQKKKHADTVTAIFKLALHIKERRLFQTV